MESFFPNFLQNKFSLSEQHNWFIKVFVSSKKSHVWVSCLGCCFTPTQGYNKAEVKNTCDGYWPLTFQLEMPLIPLKKETGGEEGKQTKMNSTDFSSKNPRNRQTCFISSPVMRWQSEKENVNYSEQRQKLCQKIRTPRLGSPGSPWLSTSRAVSHCGSGLPEPPGSSPRFCSVPL